MSGTGKNYYFLDRKRLLKKSTSISAKVEGMVETFEKFHDILEGLTKEPYLEFQYLAERAGLNEKLLKKIDNAIKKYRELYFNQLGEIQQTSIDDFKGGN